MKNGLKRRPGVVRVLVALARMIQDYLWARASRLLDVTTGGVWDSFVLLPSPQDFGMLGVFCARFPPREARLLLTLIPARVAGRGPWTVDRGVPCAVLE